MHTLEYDESFYKDLSALNKTANVEIGQILFSLQNEAFFEPSDQYLFERSKVDQSCACTHSSGSWGGWKLLWYYQYSTFLPSTVEVIIVMLAYEPVALQPIKPR
ncbi:MAG: hypothetical protein WCA92_04205 [Terriglobales bacterium]